VVKFISLINRIACHHLRRLLSERFLRLARLVPGCLIFYLAFRFPRRLTLLGRAVLARLRASVLRHVSRSGLGGTIGFVNVRICRRLPLRVATITRLYRADFPWFGGRVGCDVA